jgi:hypothetical protein
VCVRGSFHPLRSVAFSVYQSYTCSFSVLSVRVRALALCPRARVRAVNDARKMRSRSGSGARRRRSMEQWVMSSQTCSPIFNKRRSHRSSINFNKNFNKNLTSFSIPDSGVGRESLLGKVKKIGERHFACTRNCRGTEGLERECVCIEPMIPRCSGL